MCQSSILTAIFVNDISPNIIFNSRQRLSVYFNNDLPIGVTKLINLYLQAKRDSGKSQALVRPSMTVKGIEVAISRSDIARLKMKMFLAVLISFLLTTADNTSKFSTTKTYLIERWAILRRF